MQALQLMGIGLATVFSVLLLIILLGNWMISLINKYAPEEEKPQPRAAQPAAVDSNVRQAVDLAIRKLTNGNSKLEKIEKI